MTYRERQTGVTGVVLWERIAASGSGRSRILPDGCLDLIWDGDQLLVAGPDSAARWHVGPAGASYAGLRFHYGTGSALLDVPASDVRDRTPRLSDVWPSATARVLGERVAEDPAAALTTWVAQRARDCRLDPFGPRVHALAQGAIPVAQAADRLGMSARQLHRRCLPVFGYGPRRLLRILRLTRALEQARSGAPLAGVAASCGYADQAHLCREVLALAGTTPTALLAEDDS